MINSSIEPRSPVVMSTPILDFQPIDLERHRDLCVQFRADAFTFIFGSADLFYEEDGQGSQRYLQWLSQRIGEIPNSCVHVWQGDRIIGQIEMRRCKEDSSKGYVNLFYLIPEFRFQGLGKELDLHATSFFQQLGCPSARLIASSNNISAMRFYVKQGWLDLGQPDSDPKIHYFEKIYKPDERKNVLPLS
jgi:ribosomal protein S18 acetylase RimI-like enzyme